MNTNTARTLHNLCPRAVNGLREIARSFGSAIKSSSTSGREHPIKAFLQLPSSEVAAMIDGELTGLSLLGQAHLYHHMTKEQRAAYRDLERPFVESIFSGLKHRGIDLTSSTLPVSCGYPDLNRLFMNELHRANGMGYRMVSVVADEEQYDGKALQFAFRLGREFAARKLLPVVGQYNRFIRAFVLGLEESSAPAVGLFAGDSPLRETDLNIVASTGDIRSPIMGRAGRALLRIGGDDIFGGAFQNGRQSVFEPFDQQFPLGAQLVARNEFIPSMSANALDPSSMDNILAWIDSVMLPPEEDSKYDLLASRKLFHVSVIGSANIDIECPVECLALDGILLGEELASNGFLIINGAGPGVMLQASIGSARAGGISAGIVPGLSYAASNHSIDIPVATGIGLSRDTIVARSGKAVIAFPGSSGTMDEILIAMAAGKPIISYHAPIPDGCSYPKLYRAGSIDQIMDILSRIKAHL